MSRKPENSGEVTLSLYTDPSSAKAAWQRRGSGRLKHMAPAYALRKPYIRLQKVPTTTGPRVV